MNAMTNEELIADGAADALAELADRMIDVARRVAAETGETTGDVLDRSGGAADLDGAVIAVEVATGAKVVFDAHGDEGTPYITAVRGEWVIGGWSFTHVLDRLTPEQAHP